MSFAILRGRNGRRHEADFGDDRVTVDVTSGESTVQITVVMADYPAPSHRCPFAMLALPRDALLMALHASLARPGLDTGRAPLPVVPDDAGGDDV